MTGTSDTMVIHEITHPYILPAVMLIFFGMILLYNIYGLASRHVRMKRLSAAEGMIISGHKKLVANHEELFVEGVGALDGNFMKDQIAGNMAEIYANNAEEYKKREEKARLRAKKREEDKERRIIKAEQKQLKKRKKKLTPEQALARNQRDVRRYDACYKMLMIDAHQRMKRLEKELNTVSEKDQRYINYLTGKYGNSVEKKELQEKLQKEQAAKKKKMQKEHRKALAKARNSADADLFSEKK